MQKTKKLFNTRTLVILALISAIAFVLAAVVRFPVLPGPILLRYDPKDIVIVIGGFLFGPLAAFAVTVVVAFTEMITVSQNGPWGFLMNVISGSAFACTASFIYSKRRTLGGAIVGLALGTLTMTAVMMLWNYIVVPLYMPHVTQEFVLNYLFVFFAPFNLFNGIVNSSLALLLYKPVTTGLRKSGLLPAPPKQEGKKKIFSPGVIAVSVFLIVTAVLWSLAMQGVWPFN